jgi:sugar phosphate isomerase/epimerase
MEKSTCPLGVHHLCAIETDPVSFVAIAAETGCQEVSLFARQPGSRSNFPLLDSGNKQTMAAALRDNGIRLANIESFLMTPVTDVQAFEADLALGADLGARGVGVQLFDDDETRVETNLAALCEQALRLGLKVSVEFMPFTPAWKTLPEMAGLVARLAQPNLTIGIDALHLVRSGGEPTEITKLPPGLVGYAQLCDGANLAVTADYAEEAVGNRLAPGAGVFPLASFLQALPGGTPLELEVPQPPLKPPLERVRDMVGATRRLMAAVTSA